MIASSTPDLPRASLGVSADDLLVGTRRGGAQTVGQNLETSHLATEDGRRAKQTRYHAPAYGRGVIVMLRCVLVVWLLQAAGVPETAS